MALTQDQLVARLIEVCLLDGDFVLRSGARSTKYFDKFRFEADPTLLAEVARHLAKVLPADTEVLAAPELGGIPLVTALSLETGLPAAFVRKEAKRYGTSKAVEGAEINGKKVTMIEDVVTTGETSATTLEGVRKLGATVSTLCSVVYRGEGSPAPLDAVGVELRPLVRAAEHTDL